MEGVERSSETTFNAPVYTSYAISGGRTRPTVPAPESTDREPEKKLTLFALQLAVLEKAASRLGTLSFIWATVVLLGGFASALTKTDFYVVTTILLIEGTRIFSRSHELEWQQHATWISAGAGWFSLRALKSSSRCLLRPTKAVFRTDGKLSESRHSPEVRRVRFGGLKLSESTRIPEDAFSVRQLSEIMRSPEAPSEPCGGLQLSESRHSPEVLPVPSGVRQLSQNRRFPEDTFAGLQRSESMHSPEIPPVPSGVSRLSESTDSLEAPSVPFDLGQLSESKRSSEGTSGGRQLSESRHSPKVPPFPSLVSQISQSTHSPEAPWVPFNFGQHFESRRFPKDTFGGRQPFERRRSPEVPPVLDGVFPSKNISIILYWLQPISAIACVVLSLMRLIKQDYGDDSSNNRKPALIIFYGLALAEALLFLLERAYWELKVSYGKLLDVVCSKYDLGPTGIAAIKRFFYGAYSKCLNGSIFDGLKMDLVTFSEELLDSDFPEEQLMGARLLQKFVNSEQFAAKTVRKVGTSTWVMERLIEMLSWKNQTEAEIRQCAAEIVSKLAGKKPNALRISGIPGSIESISSLLYTGPIAADQADYDFSVFNELGLLILKELADDHDNCGKIGNARGLLSKVVDFTIAPVTPNKAVERSLEVMKMLVSTTGNTGKMLRQRVSEIVFAVRNIRHILENAQGNSVLLTLGIEVLTGLAMDENAREIIGRTGGVIKLLLSILFRLRLTEDDNSVSSRAGKALARLALENKKNCHRILKEKEALELLIGSLSDPVLQLNASSILRNLCAYSEINHATGRLRGVTVAIPTVLEAVMIEEGRRLEVSIGLATQICKFMRPQEFAEALGQTGIRDIDIVERLVQILIDYYFLIIKVPRIRRFVIEQATWMMKSDKNYIQLFKNLEMEKLLEGVADTTSELECFHTFSGSIGLSKYRETVSSLVDTALELMLGVEVQGQSSSDSQADGGNTTQPAGKLQSISAMPVYKAKSHEELRWEDDQLRAFQTATSAFEKPGFGRSASGGQRGGSRLVAYTATSETDGGSTTHPC